MNKEKLLKQVIPHIPNWDDDWGFGQLSIDKILKMVEVGKKINLTFRFVKKVTAMDDLWWKERTITASKDWLFVFPSDNRDLTEFWNDVDKIK